MRLALDRASLNPPLPSTAPHPPSLLENDKTTPYAITQRLQQCWLLAIQAQRITLLSGMFLILLLNSQPATSRSTEASAST